jgi:uncharacterized Zn finger protein (UPF0148 family)
MAKEILGHITCPHCGNDKATVHKQAKGSRALYYRCYPEDSDPCGTVQIILKGGQKFINENMRPLNKVEQKIAADDMAENAKVEQKKAAEKVANKVTDTKKKSGVFNMFLEDSMA